MKPENDEGGHFGLLATGSAGCWSVDLDESADGTVWSLQLDGPQCYIAFALSDLGVIPAAVAYLRSRRNATEALPLGRFASAAVSLHRDDEADRCFLIVSPNDGSAFRATLSAEDAESLAEALGQILKDLSTD